MWVGKLTSDRLHIQVIYLSDRILTVPTVRDAIALKEIEFTKD